MLPRTLFPIFAIVSLAGTVLAASGDSTGASSGVAAEPAPAVSPTTPEALVAVERLNRFAAGAAAAKQAQLIFVYFTPADRDPPADRRVRLGRMMRDMQGFYGDEMARHGLGPRNVAFELDADQALRVHEVRGEHSREYYLGRDPAKGHEIRLASRPVLQAAGIDDERETVIYFCHLRDERDGRVTGIGPYYGTGARSGPFRCGHCWFTDASILDPERLTDRTTMLDDEEYGHISVGRYNTIFIGGAAHELGHGLGLPHTRERPDEAARGVSLMGGGNQTYRQELRGHKHGSFLPLADALRLASHPIFSGVDRDLDMAPRCRLEDLRVESGAGELRVAGRLAAEPEPYAIIGYYDPAGHSDYDATSWTAPLDASNGFSLRISELQPGDAELRLVALHVNGATSVFRSPLKIDEDRTPDAAGVQFSQKP